MLYATPHLKPSEMPALTGVSIDRLKDWRRVGLFDDDDEAGSLIGTQQENGRWLYSISDAVVLATMNALRNTGLDRVTLLDFSRRMERGVQKALGFDVSGAGLFAVFWLDDWLEQDSGFSGLLTDNPRDVHTVESSTTFLFDLALIAQHTLPDDLLLALAPVRQTYNDQTSEFGGGADG
ncbi:hypothetical protein AB9K41_23160 [Cribrihabitans sp. XS_ASV171]